MPSTAAASPEVLEGEIVEVEPVAIATIPSRFSDQRSQDLAMCQRSDRVLGNVKSISNAIADRFGDLGEQMADQALARMEQRFNQRLNEGAMLLGQKQGVVQQTSEGNES